MARLHALVRAVPAAISACELTHLEREPIDLARAREQHAAGVAALRSSGVVVEELPEEPALADSVFVEDAAVVVDELAVLTLPGAESRRAELASVEAALSRHREVARLEAPGTLDGGDVVVLGKRVFVGLSSRSNAAGITQLGERLAPFGYSVRGVSVRGCLHLKSAATRVRDDLVLVQPAWVDPSAFAGAEALAIDPSEPAAANVVAVEVDGAPAVHLHGAQYPRTRERLEGAGLTVVPVLSDELAKAEGAVSCCSILFRSDAR